MWNVEWETELEGELAKQLVLFVVVVSEWMFFSAMRLPLCNLGPIEKCQFVICDWTIRYGLYVESIEIGE